MLLKQVELEDLIYAKRQEMMNLAFNKGSAHVDTIKCSQSLDKLLNMLESTEEEKVLEAVI